MHVSHQLERAHSLARAHGAANIGLRSLPTANQEVRPGAWEPLQLIRPWAKTLLSKSDTRHKVDHTCGTLARYNRRLVCAHADHCPECTASSLCGVAQVLDLWITYGVDLRVFCTEASPSKFPKTARVQSHLRGKQLEHMDKPALDGGVESCKRSALECVGNCFLVGVHERPTGTTGVERIGKEAGCAEAVSKWVGAVQTTAKERLVMDMRGLNGVTKDWPFAYDSLTRIADQYEPGDKLGVLDLSSAFHLIPIAKSSWPLLGLKIQDHYWVMKRLPFGYSAAPAICSVFTGMLARIMEQHPSVKAVCCYVDDFFILHEGHTTMSAQRELVAQMNEVGTIVKAEKCQFGSCVNFTGFEVKAGAERLEMRMTASKQARVEQELEALCLLAGHALDGHLEDAIDKICGRLQWYWPALARSYAWMAPFHLWRSRARAGEAEPGAPKPHGAREALEQALRWWLARVRGAARRWTALGKVDYHELAVVDASGPHEDGQFTFGGCLWRRGDAGWRLAGMWQGVAGGSGQSTQAAELEAILSAWSRMSSQAGLVVSDSTAAVTAASKGYTRRYEDGVNARLRDAIECAAGIRHVIWTKRELNALADSLSRPQEDLSGRKSS